MTVTLGVVLTCLVTTAPLLIAVAVAVFSSDLRRRSDARRVVRILRTRQPWPRTTVPTTDEVAAALPRDKMERGEPRSSSVLPLARTDGPR
jgi:hypothetical protein